MPAYHNRSMQKDQKVNPIGSEGDQKPKKSTKEETSASLRRVIALARPEYGMLALSLGG